jgi:6-phosphogluconolactonase
MDTNSANPANPEPVRIEKSGRLSEAVVYEDRNALAQALAREIDTIAQASLAARKRFTLALSGGSLLDLMATGLDLGSMGADTCWSGWHLFWVDERWVPWEDPESNFGKAQKRILHRLPIPGQQIYPLDASMSPAESAQACESAMRAVFQEGKDTFPRFDLILLGIGEDGHTASLFPGDPVVDESQRWMSAVFNAPKRPPIRITMTLPVINNARNVRFVACGAGKAPIVSRLIHPPSEKPELPAERVAPAQGTLKWLVDRAAASGLAGSECPPSD